MKVFFDSDVLVDVFLKRDHFFEKSAAILTLADNKEIEGVTSALIICNLFYIVRKDIGKSKALIAVSEIMETLTVLDLKADHINDAIVSESPDFEDAVQMSIAKSNKIQYIITRNKQDFKKSKAIVITPEEFLNTVW